MPLVDFAGPGRFVGEQLPVKGGLREFLPDDGHGAPVGFEEIIYPLHLAVLIRVFQGEHAVGDDAELGSILNFHPPLQRCFDGQMQFIFMQQPDAVSPTGDAQMMLFWSFEHLDWISPRPVLFITGDHAHSRIFSEQAFKKASEPKELYVVPNAGHVDLYDRVNLIPWAKLTSFFTEHLK